MSCKNISKHDKRSPTIAILSRTKTFGTFVVLFPNYVSHESDPATASGCSDCTCGHSASQCFIYAFVRLRKLVQSVLKHIYFLFMYLFTHHPVGLSAIRTECMEKRNYASKPVSRATSSVQNSKQSVISTLTACNTYFCPLDVTADKFKSVDFLCNPD